MVDVAVCAAQIRLEVSDGGPSGRSAGAGPRPPIPGTGHGIVGMRERIGAFGGWLVAEPLADGGFHVLAEVPIEATV
jgi:signal transduction histidine kinase